MIRIDLETSEQELNKNILEIKEVINNLSNILNDLKDNEEFRDPKLNKHMKYLIHTHSTEICRLLGKQNSINQDIQMFQVLLKKKENQELNKTENNFNPFQNKTHQQISPKLAKAKQKYT